MELHEAGRRFIKRAVRRTGGLAVRWQHANYVEPHLARLLSVLNVDLVVDVGANVGQFGRLLRDEVGYKGAILSFEPTSRSFKVLSSVAAGDPNWVVSRQGLGSEPASPTIHHYRDSVMDSLLTPTDYGAERFTSLRQVESTETIDIVRLDTVLDELATGSPERVFLKTDTQGFDLHVLEGASRVFDRIAAFMLEASLKPIYEGMPTIIESLTAADELGFELTGLFPISRDAAGLSLVEVDCVFRRSK